MELIWFDHFFFIVVGILLPGMALVSERSESTIADVPAEALPPKKHLYYSNSLMLLIGALLVLTLWNVTGRSMSYLGFQFIHDTPMVRLLGGLIVLLYAIDALYNVYINKKPQDDKDMAHIMPTSWNDYKHFITLAIAAGVCEEVVFRGFLVNYIKSITSTNEYSFYIAIILPAIIFSISHLYQGWLAVSKIFCLSLLFSCLFLYSQSLVLVMALHVLMDLLSGALMVMVSMRNKS
jgi:uncharacterized protein